jgi:5-methylcytosine-specific restriction endonuclease McrA
MRMPGKDHRMIRKENGVWTYPDGREVCDKTAAGLREYKKRTEQARTRQDCRCATCNRFLSQSAATLDHEEPRGFGGANRDDRMTHDDGSWRNAALCMICNHIKGSRRFHWKDGVYMPQVSDSIADIFKEPDCPEPWSDK